MQRNKIDLQAWVAFLLGAVVCAFAIAYFEVRKEPSGLLAFDVSSTQPGTLKIFYTKDGLLTDPGWAVNFSQGNISQAASFPLSAGQYELIGFKPFVEASGKVSISNLRFLSGSGVRHIRTSNFVAINQLNTVSSQSGEIVIAPAQGANDPFGAFPNLQERVQETPFSLESLLRISSGTFVLIAVFLMLMYALSGNLPFARGMIAEQRPEPGLPQGLGLLTVGLIVLYLRNAHSIFIPVLYAEDGIWAAGLINRGFFDMLLNARADYFVFGNVLLLTIAQWSNTAFFGHNLANLPYFVSFISMLFFAGLAAAPIVLLRGVLRIEARLLLWFLVLLVPLGNSSYEVLGRLSNIGFVFPFLAFCLLIWRHYSLRETSRKQIIATDALLFLCAHTNPLCYPLIAVAFTIEAWHHWSSNGRTRISSWIKKYLVLFSTRSAIALLITLFVMGLWMLLRDKGDYTFLAGKMILSNVPEAIIARSFLYPIIFSFYSHWNDASSAVLLLIIVVIILLVQRTKGVQRERFILASAAIVLVVYTVLTIEARPGLTAMLDHYQTSNPDRYYFGLNLFVYLILASVFSIGFAAAKRSWRRIFANTLAGVLIALYLGNNMFMFEFANPRFEILPTLTFYDEVKKAYEMKGEAGPDGMRYKVALHPAPWVTHLPADYVITTANKTPYIPPLAITNLQPDLPDISPADVARKYDGKVVHKTAGRGLEDSLFYISAGVRYRIPNSNWLLRRNLSSADVIEITSDEFDDIPDSGVSVQ